jgi:DNA-binding response OmpR family regulator
MLKIQDKQKAGKMEKKSVLFIDSGEEYTDSLQEILQENGYVTRTAKDESGALELWMEEEPDYVLLTKEEVIQEWIHHLSIEQCEQIMDREGHLVIDMRRRLVKKDGKEIALTPTEYKLLTTMAKSPNRIYTREQLITYALEDEFQGYDRSIDTYIKELRRKLEEDGRNPRYIRTVHGVGYKFVP